MTDLPTVAAQLRLIEEMAQRLEARAMDQGRRVTSTGDRGIPGGEAMVNLAPIASPRQWSELIEYQERRADAALEFLKDAQPDLSHEDPDELWPAAEIITWWSEEFRQRLGMDYPGWHPTLRSEVAFLRNRDVAEWIWNNEPRWDDYTGDVARAKTKLENILHAGDRSDRTPIVCDRCDDKRPLVRVWADREHVADECQSCGALRDPDAFDQCPDCGGLMQPAYNSNADDDRWKCMGCKHLFDQEELEDALGTQKRRSEPKEWIARTEAIDLLRSMGHQTRTAAALADREDAQGWRHDVTHVRYVSWPDVWRAHLLALQAAKIRHEDTLRREAHKEMCEKTHPEDCWIPGRGCSLICPRGSDCEWFMCPVHNSERESA